MNSAQAPSRPRHAMAWLLLILLIAVSVRMAVISMATMISRDGPIFIWYAQRLADEPRTVMNEQDQHPLYPAMILASHEVIETARATVLPGLFRDDVLRWQAAGIGATLAGSILVVLAVYALACVLFDVRVALIAGFMTALTAEFIQLSADALSDMPHLALYLFSMAAGLHALQTRRYAWLLVAGALSGLAFLTRPEGAEAAIVLAFSACCLQRDTSWRRRLAGAMLVACAAGAVAAPYMAVTGRLVRKKPVDRFVTGDETADAGSARAPMLAQTDFTRHGKTVARIAQHWSRSLRVVYLLPALAWLVLRRGVPVREPGGRTIIAAMVMHFAVLFLLITRFDYYHLFVMRHVAILSGLTLPFSAAGLIGLVDLGMKRQRNLVAVATVIVLFLPTIPWAFEYRYAPAGAIRRAGEWIRSHSSARPRVLTTRHRAAFYANGLHIWCPDEPDPGWILKEARSGHAEWLVFDESREMERDRRFFLELPAALRPGESLQLIHTVEPTDPRGSPVRIYRFEPAS